MTPVQIYIGIQIIALVWIIIYQARRIQRKNDELIDIHDELTDFIDEGCTREELSRLRDTIFKLIK